MTWDEEQVDVQMYVHVHVGVCMCLCVRACMLASSSIGAGGKC